MKIQWIIRWSVWGMLGITCWTTTAIASMEMSQARTKLSQLDFEINSLKQQLSNAQNERTELQDSVSSMDDKMAIVTNQLNQTTVKATEKKQQIDVLTAEVGVLTEHLGEQQVILSKYIQVRYCMGAHQLLKAWFSTTYFYQMSRWLVFFRYLVHSHQQLIDNIRDTQIQLAQHKQLLEQAYQNYASLQTQAQQQMLQLKNDKEVQLQALEKLLMHIQTGRRTLQDYEQDKVRLTILLTNLMEANRSNAAQTASVSHEHLLSPLSTTALMTFKTWHQGVFLAGNLGEKVHAVRSGQVVFSDWLRGYGWLLIVDHGHGLMTLYGYNQTLIKHQGDVVKSGDALAVVGHSGVREEDGVYFEVRRYGKVVAADKFLLAARQTDTA